MADLNKVYKLLCYLSEVEKLNLKYSCNSTLVHLKYSEMQYIKYFKSDSKLKNYQIEAEITHIAFLPNLIQHLILRLLDHYSLIQLADAYPILKSSIMNPIYWNNFRININQNILSHSELKLLSDYIRSSTKSISIEFIRDDEQSQVLRTSTQVFENFKNLQSLEFYYSNDAKIIHIICKTLQNLRYLDIRHKNLTDFDMVLLRQSLPNLTSLHIYSSLNIDKGLIYFLKNSTHLDYIGFSVPSVDQEIFALIYELHRRTLKRISYKIDKYELTEEHFGNLIDFPLLRNLSLSFIKSNGPICNILDKLEKIEALSLEKNFTTALQNFVKTKIPITKPKLYLKRLSLTEISISNKGLRLLGLNCPNLEELSFKNLISQEIEIRETLNYFKKLKQLQITQKSQLDWQFHFLRDISDNFLGTLQFVYIHIISNEIFDHKLIKMIKDNMKPIKTRKGLSSALIVDNDIHVMNISTESSCTSYFDLYSFDII